MFVIYLLIIGIFLYYVYHFITALLNLKQKIIFPVTAGELAAIRKEPGKTIKAPTFSGQKLGIILYSLLLLYVLAMLIFIWFVKHDIIFSTYFLILYPLFFSANLFNLFAVTEKGIIIGAHFIPWKRIHYVEMKRIDVNHKYYGYSKEVNDQIELRVRTKFRTYRCIITSDEIVDKISSIINSLGITQLPEPEPVIENEQL